MTAEEEGVRVAAVGLEPRIISPNLTHIVFVLTKNKK